MPRAKKRYQRRHSSCHEDKVPLTKLLKPSEDPNCYDSLLKPSREPCDLCDKVSNSRYISIIHNIRHIIIPLINQNVCQCDICLYYFTSNKELNQHKSKKHSLTELVDQVDLIKKNFNNPLDQSYDSDWVTIVKKEEPEKVTDQVKIEIEEQSEAFELSTLTGTSSLKSRLVFEEDIIPETSDDLSIDCKMLSKVNVENFPMVCDDSYLKSIHYEQLLSPGVFRCRKCLRMFPNRYDMIIHETTHLVIGNSQVELCNICNKYVLGDYKLLRNHQLVSHYTIINSKKKLDYVDITRTHNGGKFDKRNDGQFDKYSGGQFDKRNGVNVENYSVKVATLKLCNVCLIWRRNTGKGGTYNFIRELKNDGTEYTCQGCSCKFLVINIVKHISRHSSSTRGRSKCLSNKERLKLITNRFKMMKKTYLIVLFLPFMSVYL